MDMEGALRARLLADAAVAAIVDTRITWLMRPQGAPLPAITLQTISANPTQTYKGFAALQMARVQCDCWGETPEDADALRKAAIAAAAPPATTDGVTFCRTLFEGQRDSIERLEGRDIARSSIDFIIHHQPAS